MTNIEKLNAALTEVGDQYIESAERFRPAGKGRVLLRVGAIAACAVLLVGGLAVGLRAWRDELRWKQMQESFTPDIEIENVTPWQELPVALQYPYITWENRSYSGRDVTLPEDRVGEHMDSVTATGFGEPDGEMHETSAELCAIAGISPECAVAVRYEGGETWYVSVNSFYRPATLGQFLEDLNLREELRFGPVWYSYRRQNMDYVMVRYDGVDEELIRRLLLSAEEAENVWQDNSPQPRELLEISVDVPLLGYENISLTVHEGGYITTNILDTGKMFYVGEENTDAFVDYVLNRCEGVETVFPYVESPETEENIPAETPAFEDQRSRKVSAPMGL